VRDEARYLLRHATKRWADRGRRLLEAISAGANVEEGARQVGVSRATAFNWLRTLNGLGPRRKKTAPRQLKASHGTVARLA
jgi:transposase-like protein